MFDLILHNAKIVDGSGQPAQRGAVAVRDGTIAAVAPRITADARRRVDAGGRCLAPGFIDLHAHSDLLHLFQPAADMKLRQGVCLEVVGNCGESLAPASDLSLPELKAHFTGAQAFPGAMDFRAYVQAVNTARPHLNVCAHVGHTALRLLAMGPVAGHPSPDQLRSMCRSLSECLAAGAAGLSTGLYYPPSAYADATELVALLKVVARRGRFHASHIRNEAEAILPALAEVASAGLASGAATHVAHLKLAGRRNWAQADRVVAFLERVRQKGLDLTADIYPYQHSATTILALIPPWAQSGGVAGLLARLADPHQQDKIRAQMLAGLPGWENMARNAGWDGITIAHIADQGERQWEGCTLQAAADQAGMCPAHFALELIRSTGGQVAVIAASMSEEIVARFLTLPFVMIGSDGVPTGGLPHPRLYGTFPRVLARFVRELGVLDLATAVAKMTALPARRLGLKDRGRIARGMRADLVLFEPQQVADTATFEVPRQSPVGIEQVYIDGHCVLDAGHVSRTRHGRFLDAQLTGDSAAPP
ncbi:MAG: D-aminoacylase [Desulfosarcinaceae bacterium]|nr:D-aminoacylase [Desulfosarcinaceae bacterium]